MLKVSKILNKKFTRSVSSSEVGDGTPKISEFGRNDRLEGSKCDPRRVAARVGELSEILRGETSGGLYRRGNANINRGRGRSKDAAGYIVAGVAWICPTANDAFRKLTSVIPSTPKAIYHGGKFRGFYTEGTNSRAILWYIQGTEWELDRVDQVPHGFLLKEYTPSRMTKVSKILNKKFT